MRKSIVNFSNVSCFKSFPSKEAQINWSCESHALQNLNCSVETVKPVWISQDHRKLSFFFLVGWLSLAFHLLKQDWRMAVFFLFFFLLLLSLSNKIFNTTIILCHLHIAWIVELDIWRMCHWILLESYEHLVVHMYKKE